MPYSGTALLSAGSQAGRVSYWMMMHAGWLDPQIEKEVADQKRQWEMRQAEMARVSEGGRE